MKGHGAAAGLAGGSCGRERSVPCARVEERRGGGTSSRVSPELRGPAWLSWPPWPLGALPSAERPACGVEWPELRARRAPGGEDDGVGGGCNDGLSRRGR